MSRLDNNPQTDHAILEPDISPVQVSSLPVIRIRFLRCVSYGKRAVRFSRQALVNIPALCSVVVLLPGAMIAVGRLSASEVDARPPNVIIVFTDDQGSVDAACYGASDLKTPGIDSLAETGVRFTQFYAASAVCSPSRVGLLTGRYPWVAGLIGNAGNGPDEQIEDLQSAQDETGLMGSEVTMAEMFRAAGYTTAHIGKWHLGHGEGMRPLDQGFDYSFGHMGGCIDNYSHFMYWSGPNRHDLFENHRRVRLPGKFFPDLMVEKAARFMQQHQDRPFFIYFAMNTPHYPYQGEPDWMEQYRNLPYPRNLYAAFLSTLDARIAKLVQTVDDLGIRGRTIIVFQSDHGHSTEQRAHGGGGDNGPYRGAKFSLFEGGIRVPAIICWPGHLPEGEVRSQMAHSCDWLPTLAELCGVELPATTLHGESLVDVIRTGEKETPHEVLHWRMGDDQWAVRQGPWKLIHRPNPAGDGPELTTADREWFLANLDEDPGETTNLARTHPAIVDRLRQLAK